MFIKNYTAPTWSHSPYSNYTSITVGSEYTPLRELPFEIRSYIQAQKLELSLKETQQNIDLLHSRITEIENFLSGSLEVRLDKMETLLKKMLTPSHELALGMTSDKEEIRRITDEIINIKRSMGAPNV